MTPSAALGAGAKRRAATAEAEVARLQEEMRALRVAKEKAEAQLKDVRNKNSQQNQNQQDQKEGKKSGPAYIIRKLYMHSRQVSDA